MSDTVSFKSGQRIGQQELELLQEFGATDRKSLAIGLAETLPAVLTTTASDGTLGSACEPSVSGTDVLVAPGSVLMADGTFLDVVTELSVTPADPSTDLKLILRSAQTPYNLGTMALSIDRLTLTYTAASGSSLQADDLYAQNDHIHLLDGGSSLGTFRILSVSTNTVTLASVVPGSGTISGLTHALAGKFFPGFPLVGETTDLVSLDSASISLEASGYTVLENEIQLATVTRAGAVVTLTDTRVAIRAKGVNAITNANVLDNAAIAESKISLAASTTNAKNWAHQQNTDTHTSSSTFYIGGAVGTGRRALTTDDLPRLVEPVSTSGLDAVVANVGSVSLIAAETQQLSPTASGPRASAASLSYESSNELVATVSATGLVTGVGAGTAIITVYASVTASGNFTAATVTAYVAVTVTASNGILRTVALDQETLHLGLNSAVSRILTASYEEATGSVPTVTYAWATSDDTVCDILALPGGTANPSTGLTAVAAGTATITVTASAPTDGTFDASSLTATCVVTVSPDVGLLGEPNLQVRFESIPSSVPGGGGTAARVTWGIEGTAVASGLTLTVASDHGYTASTALPANSLYGQKLSLLGGAFTEYFIESHSAIAASTAFTVTVSKLDSADPSPTSNPIRISSFAVSLVLEVFDTTTSALTNTGDAIYTADWPRASDIYGATVLSGAASAVVGNTYRFVLRGVNSTLPGSPAESAVSATWGDTRDSSTSVTIPSDWITARATYGGVIFTWPAPTGYSRAKMDYFVSYAISPSATWSEYQQVPEFDTGNSGRFVVQAPSASTVQLRVYVGTPSGTLVTGAAAGYDATADAVVLTASRSDFDIQYDYEFDVNGASWVETPSSSGRFVLVLDRFGPNPFTSFPRRSVMVTRIDVAFNTPLVGSGVTVKAIVYPTDNFNYQIAGNPTDVDNSTTDIDTAVFAAANSPITVALERIGGTPTSGAGYVSVWFRTNADEMDE